MLLKLRVNGTHASDLSHCQTKCAFVHVYMYSILVSMFIMFPVIELRNCMVPEQNTPQSLNYY